MSFLAQLREKTFVVKQGLALCYVLKLAHPEKLTCSATLQLQLAEFEQDQFCHKTGRYPLQKYQLISPPPFLCPEDIPLLQNLLDSNAQWQGADEGPLPNADLWLLLEKMVNSGRCFVANRDDHWQIICNTGQSTLEKKPFWHISPYGEYSLQWLTDTAETLFWIGEQLLCLNQTKQHLSAVTATFSTAALPLLKQWPRLDADQVPEFLNCPPPGWTDYGLPLPPAVTTKQESAKISPVLRFDSVLSSNPRSSSVPETQDILRLEFRYSSDLFCVTFDPGSELAVHWWDGKSLHYIERQPEAEQAITHQLLGYLDNFSQISPGCWQSEDINHWHQLLDTAQSQLCKLGFNYFFEPNFSYPLIVPDPWHIGVKQTDPHHWQLEIQLPYTSSTTNDCSKTTTDYVDLIRLLDRLDESIISSSDQYFCLALDDGRQLLLARRQINLLQDELAERRTSGHRSGASFPINQINRLTGILDALPADSQRQDPDNLALQAQRWQQTPTQHNFSLAGLNAQLRPYQQQGVCWLQYLKSLGINGLLADDMGLGKTLQTIAHLYLEKQSGALQAPALIIAPSSLLHNWTSELKRFAPSLSIQILHGPQRHALWSQLTGKDIVITSYALLLRDLKHWQNQPVSWLILDEAQQIKNPRTRISQAVRQLPARHRLCLSGTPMENHLGELWSLFDFLMPACLGSEKSFKRHFRKPIEQQGNQQRFQQLLTRIAPFMLRRCKDQVATDLPPKTEITRTIAMHPEQEDFYQQLRHNSWQKLQQQLENSDATDNSGQQHILALTVLLKLRQACCDPQLLGENITSTKRQHCIEMIEELSAEGRAVLVFSQFTRMLDLLAAELDTKAISYLMLTGVSRQRQQLVESFQAGDANVFLISLKAGGTGLNLTHADTVIHYDPWWNNAAEQQASDRAHRIGQDKPVFVYKLIMENSIEEKIALLQDQKAQLGQHVNEQAISQSHQFALHLDELLGLLSDE